MNKNIRKHAWLLCAIIILSLCEIPLLLLSVAAFIGAFPIGIVMFGLCGLLGWGIVKIIRKDKIVKSRIKEYRATLHQSSSKANILGDTTYCFASPLNTQDTARAVINAFLQIGGEVKQCSENNGYIQGVYRINTKRTLSQPQEVEFFISHGDKLCKVRSFFKKCANDDVFDQFLTALFSQFPDTDFGVSLANGFPYVMGVLYLGVDTEQVQISHTKKNTSIIGFLLGGALFGDAGAIVGGMSGKQRTVGNTYTQFSNSQLARIIYNNGRLWEGTITKGSKLYNEIMVNLN